MEESLHLNQDESDEACALRALITAARAWCSSSTSIAERHPSRERELRSREALDALMGACEAIHRMRRQAGARLRPIDVVGVLRSGLKEVVSSADSEPLLEGPLELPRLTDYALELLEWAREDPEAREVGEGFSALMAALQVQRQTAPREAAEAYRRFRRSLIEEPLAPQRVLFQRFSGLEASWKTFYQEIPSSCRTGPGEIYAHACPGCHWTLQRRWDGHFGCPHRACLENEKALYAADEGGNLRPLKGAAASTPVQADGLRRARPFVWRRFVLPGLQEIELERRLREANRTVRIELWPDLDTYDLRIDTGKEPPLQVDVKAWRHAHMLADHLREKPPRKGVIIAVPDTLRGQTGLLRRRVAPEVEVITFSDLCDRVGRSSS